MTHSDYEGVLWGIIVLSLMNLGINVGLFFILLAQG
jgi:hypothetical protein